MIMSLIRRLEKTFPDRFITISRHYKSYVRANGERYRKHTWELFIQEETIDEVDSYKQLKDAIESAIIYPYEAE